MEYQFKTSPYKHQLNALNDCKDKENWAFFMDMGTGKTKGVAFSQFGGGGVRGKTKKRRHIKRRRSHKRRVTSVRKNSRRRVRR